MGLGGDVPTLNPPRLASLAGLSGNQQLVGLDSALRAQDSFAQDITRYVNKSLVVGDSVQTWTPYGVMTGQVPLVVPSDSKALVAGSGWSVVTAATYTQDSNGWVEVFGVLSGGVLGSVILTGAPPAAQATVRTVNANNAYGRCVVGTTGAISFDVGSVTNVDTFFSYRTTSRAPYVPSCFPFDLLWQFNYPPTIILAKAQDVTNPATPTNLSLGVPDWVMVVQGGRQFVRIRNMPGLLPSVNYAVQVVGF